MITAVVIQLDAPLCGCMATYRTSHAARGVWTVTCEKCGASVTNVPALRVEHPPREGGRKCYEHQCSPPEPPKSPKLESKSTPEPKLEPLCGLDGKPLF